MRNRVALAVIAAILTASSALPCTEREVHLYFDGCSESIPSITSVNLTVTKGGKTTMVTFGLEKQAGGFWLGTSPKSLSSGDSAKLSFNAVGVRTSCDVVAEYKKLGPSCAIVYRVSCVPLWKISVASLEKKQFDFSYWRETTQNAVKACDDNPKARFALSTPTIIADAGFCDDIAIAIENLNFQVRRNDLLRLGGTAPLFRFATKSMVDSPDNTTLRSYSREAAKQKQPNLTVSIPPPEKGQQ
jgi:hypothetical protein